MTQRKTVLKTDGEIGVRLVMRLYLLRSLLKLVNRRSPRGCPLGRLADLLGRWVRGQTA